MRFERLIKNLATDAEKFKKHVFGQANEDGDVVR